MLMVGCSGNSWNNPSFYSSETSSEFVPEPFNVYIAKDCAMLGDTIPVLIKGLYPNDEPEFIIKSEVAYEIKKVNDNGKYNIITKGEVANYMDLTIRYERVYKVFHTVIQIFNPNLLLDVPYTRITYNTVSSETVAYDYNGNWVSSGHFGFNTVTEQDCRHLIGFMKLNSSTNVVYFLSYIDGEGKLVFQPNSEYGKYPQVKVLGCYKDQDVPYLRVELGNGYTVQFEQ